MNATALLEPTVVDEPGNGRLEIWQLPIDEPTLTRLFTDIFGNWWQHIDYGILIQGGVLEFKPACAPTKMGVLDGYLTVEFGSSGHLHLCVGWNNGYHCARTAPEVAEIRLPSRVELFRKLNASGQPTFWCLRAFNSRKPEAEQTMTIFLPNPLLIDTPKGHDFAPTPDWSKLEMWDYLRSQYLGITDPDPRDRLALRFAHD